MPVLKHWNVGHKVRRTEDANLLVTCSMRVQVVPVVRLFECSSKPTFSKPSPPSGGSEKVALGIPRIPENSNKLPGNSLNSRHDDLVAARCLHLRDI